jgi:hypothetical protein
LCQRCRKHLSFGKLKQEFARMLAWGLSREQARSVLPRCRECVTVFFQREEIVLPFVRIARARHRVYAVDVPLDAWQTVHYVIKSAGARYAAARRGDKLLVVTNMVIPDTEPWPPERAADQLEQAIINRPEGVYPRFVASKEWGGED